MADEPQMVLLEDVVSEFDRLIGRIGEHAVVCGDQVYVQPHVYLSLHLVQMRAAGWADVDFDDLAAVSGASALFGYKRDDFMPKYAHTQVDPDGRIARATGFGYEWIPFEGAQGAWHVIKESVDSGRSVKGWDWENILFAGYRDADAVEGRQVYAMADGPVTYAKWLSWSEFGEWVARMTGCKSTFLGRFAQRVPTDPAEEVAARVIKDLVAWSEAPPDAVRRQYEGAAFGLAGIAAYGADCADLEAEDDLVACHPINPQWTIRNASANYLRRVAEGQLFDASVNVHLRAAAENYWGAYTCWQAFYALLGHRAPEGSGKNPLRREAGAAVVRAWLDHERAAVGELNAALTYLSG
jgi:hypothetical protein